jgi:predicted flap endonuclease-1-like 5' DNA nuclease
MARRRRKQQAVQEERPPAPRLELVLEPGPVKHLDWDADPRDAVAPAPSAVPPPILPETPAQPDGPLLAGRRRTLYTTERGNEVVAYDRPRHGRALALTERRGGRVLEVPFDERQVDQAIRDVSLEPQPLQEQEAVATGTPAEPVSEGKPKRFGLFRRRKGEPKPVDGQVYRPAIPVDGPLVPFEQVRPVAEQAQQVSTGSEDAWEPESQGTRPALRESAPRVPRKTPARRRRRTAGKAKKAVPKARRAKPARRRRAATAYSGDNHPVIDIEGIGPTYAKRLEKAGITTTGLLAIAKTGAVAKKSKAPLKTVKAWKYQADLLKVKGVGPQYAEALARAGVRGIDGLKGRPSEKIAKQVTKYLDSLETTVVGQPVTEKRVAKWQRRANRMRKVRIDKAKLAIPDHGIPPPWLREQTKAGKPKPSKKTGRKAAKPTGRARTPKALRRPARKAARKSAKRRR